MDTPRVINIRDNSDRSSLFDVHVPKIQAFVRKSDLLAVGGPDRAVKKRRWIAKIDFLHFAEAGLVHEMQSVLAGFVREEGDPFAVWRPGGIAFCNGRRASQIADVAFFRRRCKNFSTGFENGARAVWGNTGVLNLVRNFHPMRTRRGQISGDLDFYV